MVGHAKRIVLVLIGIVSLMLGILGVFLPLLPTTPFVLVSAFAFANSSDKLHRWLLEHEVFGPLITNWRQYGAISRTTKIVSTLSMIAIMLLSLIMGVPTYIVVVQALILSVSATFVLTRPLPPQQ